MSNAAAPQIVVCAGIRVSAECARVVAAFGQNGQGNDCHFVMSEWLNDNQFRRAVLLWVVDSSTTCDDVNPALRSAIPLLVPEESPQLIQLCVDASCGMWYRNEIDARLCLEHLLASSTIREHLGANGQAYLNRRTSLLKQERSDRAFAAAAR